MCGHSSRRRVTANAHQRPTRRFRQQHWNSLTASGRCRARPCSWPTPPSLFGLAPCGVYPASVITAGAVRSYRTFSPLLGTGRPGIRPSGQTLVPKHAHPAVFFLWHWPSTGFETCVPDVIRHTALRSSDFPLPHLPVLAEKYGSDRPVLLPRDSVRGFKK